MIEYVFFDLDETLIDIKLAQNKAVESLYVKYGFDTKATLENFIRKWDELTEYHYAFYSRREISYNEQRVRRIVDLFKAFNIVLEEEPLTDYYLMFFENAWSVYSEVNEVLETLVNRGYKLGIISNGDYDQQLQKIEKTGIRKYFDFINTSSQLEYSKPNPMVYAKVFNMHNINYENVCYVGDNYKKDILPCRSLGIRAILINRNNKHYEYNDLVSINNLKDIIPLIEKWTREKDI